MLKPSKDDPNHAKETERFNRDNGQWGGDVQKNEQFIPKKPEEKK